MKKQKRLLDVTYSEWLNYYNRTCECECNDGVFCPYRIGACCLGDILSDKDNKTLEMIIAKVEDRDVVVEEF
jgi:hypothetical protein